MNVYTENCEKRGVSGNLTDEIICLVGEQIASGNCTRNEDNESDDFEGIITTDDGKKYQVTCNWPDYAESHEVDPDFTEIGEDDE